MPKITVTQTRTKLVLELKIRGQKIGEAMLANSDENLRLDWIEIIEQHQGKGYGSLILQYIIDNVLHENQRFIINVVDEQTLPFYYNFFKKIHFHEDIVDTWLINTGIHPEVHIPEGSLQIMKETPRKLIF